MKNVYLFQVNFQIGYGKFATYWLPYAVAKIWSYCKLDSNIEKHWSPHIEFLRQDISTVITEMKGAVPDVVGFSSYVWNHNYNLELAKHIREEFPDTLIIFGGPQIPSRPSVLSKMFEESPFIDYTIHGEGEIPFRSILSGEDVSGVTGISSKNRIDTSPKRIRDLSTTGSPFLDGTFDNILKQNPEKKFSVTLETTRGCPYACTFCDWGSLTFNKVTKTPVDVTMQEIEWISENRIRFVDVSDANFGIMKQRDFGLLEHMITYKNKTGYPETYSFNWQKNSTSHTLEMIAYLTENNSARGFTLSTQSMSPIVLSAIKRNNLGISNFENILAECAIRNVQTYSELILGLPNETFDSWKTGIAKLLSHGQHSNIEVWLCQMLENAELNSVESREQYGIKTVYVSNYIGNEGGIEEGVELVKSTKSMGAEELLDAYMFGWVVSNFHCFGWTQIVSRWLDYSGEMSYLEFYENFVEFILGDDHLGTIYRGVRYRLKAVLSGGKTEGNGLHYLMAGSQQQLHKAWENTWDSVVEYLERYDVPSVVIGFNKDYLTSVNADAEKIVVSDIPVWELVNSVKCDDAPVTYRFWDNNYTNDPDRYYAGCYFQRRKGWGKYNVERVS